MKQLFKVVQEEAEADVPAEYGEWWEEVYSSLETRFAGIVKPAIKRDCFSYHWIGTLIESDHHLAAAQRIQRLINLIAEHASVRYVEIDRELLTTKERADAFSDAFLDMLGMYKEVYPANAEAFEFSEQERLCVGFHSASTMQELDWLINSGTYVSSYAGMI